MNVIRLYSGITCGRVLSGELYTQILQKLTFLYLSNIQNIKYKRQIQKD